MILIFLIVSSVKLAILSNSPWRCEVTNHLDSSMYAYSNYFDSKCKNQDYLTKIEYPYNKNLILPVIDSLLTSKKLAWVKIKQSAIAFYFNEDSYYLTVKVLGENAHLYIFNGYLTVTDKYPRYVLKAEKICKKQYDLNINKDSTLWNFDASDCDSTCEPTYIFYWDKYRSLIKRACNSNNTLIGEISDCRCTK